MGCGGKRATARSGRNGRRALALAAGAVLAAAAAPALAHGVGLPLLPRDAWSAWSLDPLVVVPLLLSHALYGLGLRAWRRRLGRRPRAVPGWRVASFALGEIALVLALLSPIDAAGGTLMTAHMVQHVILVAVAPPLLVLGRPEWAWSAGLPAALRGPLLAGGASRVAQRAFGALARPVPAAALHALALWAWHAPGLFELAKADEVAHALEHASFFGTALLFWRAVLAGTPVGARAGADARAAAPAALAISLATIVHGGLLSALICLSPTPLYPESTRWAPLWGLTPLEDQQLAGAVMWVPASLAYLVAAMTVAATLIQPARGAGGGQGSGRAQGFGGARSFGGAQARGRARGGEPAPRLTRHAPGAAP